ncbi:MAG: carboxymuconolactone decarboxylase family protein [Candidatus Tectomicrobia bacterium]
MQARIPQVTRESVPSEHLDAFDDVVRMRNSVPQTGPLFVMLNSPEMCRRVWSVVDYVWNVSILPKKIQELAMLVAAREHDCQYIWNAHAPSGRAAGLGDDLVDALRDGTSFPDDIPHDEAVVIQYGQEFYRTHRVSPGTFQQAQEVFGVQALTELTTTLGLYALLAFNVNAFDVPLPDERKEPVMPM